MNSQNPRHSSQSGATLIVSLIILAVITLLGIASIRSSNLELKMAASARDRAVAFQRAEAALSRIENSLKGTPPPYRMNNFASTCSGRWCFNENCDNGLCFAGDFDGAKSTTQCKLSKNGVDPKEFWKDKALWESKAQSLSVAKSSALVGDVEDVRYLIEFMCFVPRSEQVITGSAKEGDADVPLFRITVKAKGESERSTVMLQSTYRVSE